jgi:hypothetical protein
MIDAETERRSTDWLFIGLAVWTGLWWVPELTIVILACVLAFVVVRGLLRFIFRLARAAVRQAFAG